MPQDECTLMLRSREERAAEKRAQEQARHRSAIEEAARDADKRAAQEKRQSDLKAARAQSELEYKERQRLEDEAEGKRQATAERRAAEATADRRARCGSDYQSPKIGMSVDRVKECVTPVKMTSQINRADGIVSTYQGGGAYFHVMEGRVIAWGR
ncbi:hypothetical protein [Pseudacidovorax sp.]|uniref:hypothetical protein n=1 Tax=Pseudacidovorax sp. TaxID=1934311 RepID=UPI0025FF53C1|nr:hypothetical protein [Pseudacidovorax sp.]